MATISASMSWSSPNELEKYLSHTGPIPADQPESQRRVWHEGIDVMELASYPDYIITLPFSEMEGVCHAATLRLLAVKAHLTTMSTKLVDFYMSGQYSLPELDTTIIREELRLEIFRPWKRDLFFKPLSWEHPDRIKLLYPRSWQGASRKVYNELNDTLCILWKAKEGLEDLLEHVQHWTKLRGPFPLENLPLELRCNIYKMICGDLGTHYHIKSLKGKYLGRKDERAMMTVNKKVREEFSEEMFKHVSLDILNFEEIPNKIALFDTPHRQFIKNLIIDWVYDPLGYLGKEYFNKRHDTAAATAITSAFPNLQNLEIRIKFVPWKNQLWTQAPSHKTRNHQGHWIAHSTGIQKLIAGYRDRGLKSVSITRKARRLICVDPELDYDLNYLQEYLNERLVKSSAEAKAWPEKYAKIVEDLVAGRYPIKTRKDTREVVCALQTLGYTESQIMSVGPKAIGWNTRRIFEALIDSVPRESIIEPASEEVVGSKPRREVLDGQSN